MTDMTSHLDNQNPIFESVYITIRYILDILSTTKALNSITGSWSSQQSVGLGRTPPGVMWVRILLGEESLFKNCRFFFINWGLKWLSRLASWIIRTTKNWPVGTRNKQNCKHWNSFPTSKSDISSIEIDFHHWNS